MLIDWYNFPEKLKIVLLISYKTSAIAPSPSVKKLSRWADRQVVLEYGFIHMYNYTEIEHEITVDNCNLASR